jgi:hypothetical protein
MGLGKNLTLTNSYATGSVTVTGSKAAISVALLATTAITITNAFATGAVSAGNRSTYVGGFVGNANSAGTTIRNAYSTGRHHHWRHPGAAVCRWLDQCDGHQQLLEHRYIAGSNQRSRHRQNHIAQLSASNMLTTVGWHTETVSVGSSQLVWGMIQAKTAVSPSWPWVPVCFTLEQPTATACMAVQPLCLLRPITAKAVARRPWATI